jgi:bifunctional UDP-N-acetylglucosamine pyrophosphorylase / glucosamine-1-phosphate N-acetyltransferase
VSTGRPCAVIPAAGLGTRLGAAVPKILLEIEPGVTVWHLLHERIEPHVGHTHVVVSPAGEPLLRAAAAEQIARGGVSVSVQERPTGMGDAVFGARAHWATSDAVLVVWGDQVGVAARTVAAVVDAHATRPGPRLTLPLVPMPDPYVEYVVREDRVEEVRMSREGDRCTPGGRSDVGMFCLSTAGLAAAWDAYAATAPRGAVTGELNFLPFLAHLGRAGWATTTVPVEDPDEARGINTAADLEFARRTRSRLRAGGAGG